MNINTPTFTNVSFHAVKGSDKGVYVNGIDFTTCWQGFVSMISIDYKASFIQNMIQQLAKDFQNDTFIQAISHLQLTKLPETQFGYSICELFFTCFIAMWSNVGKVEFTVEIDS